MERRKMPLKLAMTYGLILAVAIILLSIAGSLLNLGVYRWFRYLNWAVLIGVIYYCLKKYRDEHMGGLMKYGQAVGAGVYIFFFASLVYGFYNILYFAFIDPEAIERGLDLVEEMYYQQGLTEAQLDSSMALAQKVRTPFMQFFSTILGTTFLGLILSLIVAIFIKRQGDSFSQAMRGVDSDQN